MAAITEQEIQLLKGVQTEAAWTDACAQIKRAHGGDYPTDWFARVLRSGLADEILARFGHSTAIDKIPIPVDPVARFFAYVVGKTAPGAWATGSRVKKGVALPEERHGLGALGTVRGSYGPITEGAYVEVFLYLIEFDDMPGVLAFVHDSDGRLVLDEVSRV